MNIPKYNSLYRKELELKNYSANTIKTYSSQVDLTNSYDRHREEVIVSKEELLQIACKRAKERYPEGHWTIARAEEVELNIKN